MGALIGEYMLRQNRLLHAKGKWGGSGYKSADDVLDWAKWLGATTMLDYGCGKGTLKKQLLELQPALNVDEYDPAIDGKDVVPGTLYDMVICTDVMEHVEEDKVPAVLAHICSLSGRGAFLVIACRPANKLLPDGQNAHITLRPSDWWIARVREHPWVVANAKIKMRKEGDGEKEVRLWIER